MKLAGIELRYLVNDLSDMTGGYYVSNIYSISKDSLLFKLHHPEKPDIMLMFSTFGLWASSVRIEQIEQNKLLSRLRKDLIRLKLHSIEQIGTERIAYLKFRGFDKEYVLVGEFFGDGNIILCNTEMKILALLHSLDVRHRQLRVGLEYSPPPENGLDVFAVTADDLSQGRSPSLSSDRWLGRTLGLPARYVEHVLQTAGIDSKIICSDLSASDLTMIVDSLNNVVNRVVDSNRHEPVIIGNEAYPVKLTSKDVKPAPTFMDGLDRVFTSMILESGRNVQSQGTDKEILELETRLDEQLRAIDTVKAKSQAISDIARELLGLAASGASSIRDTTIRAMLVARDSEFIIEKGVPLVRISSEKVKINPEASIHSIASSLFDAAKKQSGAIPEIERLRKKTTKQLEDLKGRSAKQKESVAFSKMRKKSWYERYRWFYTSDGDLAIGGRDSSSNSSIIRKHLEKTDRVFHAEIFGSPFFILKSGEAARPAGLNEVAHATVCFSRAWRESMYGLSAYWVNPEQIRRAAPSGQFLPRGSFAIDGQRNFVRVSTLKLGVGLSETDGGYVLSCGPPDAIKKNSILYAVIEPSGLEMTDAAKKIRTEFVKLDADIINNISVDEFVRVLPAGKSHVSSSGRGEAK